MSLFRSFYPNARYKSAYDLDYPKLRKAGVQGILFDIDNTLVPHGAMPDARCIKLFAHLKELGIYPMLISNNGEARVKPMAEALACGFVPKAGKPSARGYDLGRQQIREALADPEATVIFIGDQLFTDIWGARRAKMPAILVDPIHPKEEIQILLKRKLEAPILTAYGRDVGRGLADPWQDFALPEEEQGDASPYGAYDGQAGSFASRQF